MKRVFIFSVLILFYLGISKLLSPLDTNVPLISERSDLIKLATKKPFTIIFVDAFETGFLIKTHYHKYRIVYGFDKPEEIVVQTTKKYDKENLPYLGLSFYSVSEKIEMTTPLPPGTIFVNDPAFGQWANDEHGGEYWEFYRVYSSLYPLLGWKSYSMQKKEYKKILHMNEQTKAFFGSSQEYGLDGEITKINFPEYFNEERHRSLDFKNLVTNYLQLNFQHNLEGNE